MSSNKKLSISKVWSFVIKEISFIKLDLAMVKPFRISLGSTNSYEGYLVRITTDDGITGFGEATSTPFITGDTMGSIEYELKLFSEALKGKEESPELINELTGKIVKTAKASRNAIDCALWDIIGKRSKLNVKKLLGDYRNKIKTSYTVDLVSPEIARKQAIELLEKGVDIYKIKVGSGIEEDVDRVKTVREIIGPDRMAYVDFNQAYTPRKAVEISRTLSKYGIEFLEQPVPMGDLKGLKYVRDRSEIPVFADEAIFTPYDVLNVLQSESADGINIKLMKCGGITDAIKMVNIAEAFRSPVMIGCMVETRIANSAGLAVALSKGQVKYADLDGYSSIIEDIASTGITFKEGYVSGSDLPGIGAEVKSGFF